MYDLNKIPNEPNGKIGKLEKNTQTLKIEIKKLKKKYVQPKSLSTSNTILNLKNHN